MQCRHRTTWSMGSRHPKDPMSHPGTGQRCTAACCTAGSPPCCPRRTMHHPLLALGECAVSCSSGHRCRSKCNHPNRTSRPTGSPLYCRLVGPCYLGTDTPAFHEERPCRACQHPGMPGSRAACDAAGRCRRLPSTPPKCPTRPPRSPWSSRAALCSPASLEGSQGRPPPRQLGKHSPDDGAAARHPRNSCHKRPTQPTAKACNPSAPGCKAASPLGGQSHCGPRVGPGSLRRCMACHRSMAAASLPDVGTAGQSSRKRSTGPTHRGHSLRPCKAEGHNLWPA
mmetsp:Transcript_110456/g.356530  ORF Transcript_110456/g.356530 Transcript_110456/m.356530 type:complete len:283 (-) Transcript_110456:1918-2766(-)